MVDRAARTHEVRCAGRLTGGAGGGGRGWWLVRNRWSGGEGWVVGHLGFDVVGGGGGEVMWVACNEKVVVNVEGKTRPGGQGRASGASEGVCVVGVSFRRRVRTGRGGCGVSVDRLGSGPRRLLNAKPTRPGPVTPFPD